MLKFLTILSLASLAVADDSLAYLCRGKPDNTILVNPNDCNVYVSCLGGHAFSQKCPSGLYYSEEKKYCDYPENVNCKPNGGGGGTQPETPGEHPDRKYDERCKGSNPNTPTLLPHPGDCNKFYMCDLNDWATAMKCPAGTHFSPSKQACDLPSTAGCTA